MNKKLKKMLATVSAMVMCATSVVSMSAGANAVFHDRELGPETTSLYASVFGGYIKFNFWQKATDYFDNEDIRVYVSDIFEDNEGYKYNRILISHNTHYSTYDRWYSDVLLSCIFEFDNSEDSTNFKKYLKDNNIAYKQSPFGENSVYIDYAEYRDDEYFDTLQKIKDDTGLQVNPICYETVVQITETENPLPEPTLLGDANEDGKVTIADAVFIMQALSNPDEFQLTPQGMANADIVGDGDGVTVMDALKIQEMEINM